MEGDSDSLTVLLYIYDLTSGMASVMSQMLLGRHIEGIWHTAVVIYGREYFYGGHGVQSVPPVSTIPVMIAHDGQSVFKRWIYAQSSAETASASAASALRFSPTIGFLNLKYAKCRYIRSVFSPITFTSEGEMPCSLHFGQSCCSNRSQAAQPRAKVSRFPK